MKYPLTSQYSILTRGIKKCMRMRYKLFHGHPKWVDFPMTLQLDTHNFCNLKCIYCNPQGSFDIPRGWMTLQMIDYILRYFEGYEIDVFRPFLNGDGLLEDRLPLITEMANKYIPYARIDLFTNGVAFENRHLLVDKNLDMVRFTISAVSHEMYKHIHGKDAFDIALRTLYWFRDNKLPHQKIVINFVLTGENRCELEEWKRVFKNFELDIRPLHEGIGQTSSDKAKFSLSFDEALKLSTKPVDLKFSDERFCSIWQNLSISWDGRILQCCDVPYEYNYGKVGEVDILTAWKKRIGEGLTTKCCLACNWGDPEWRKIYEKYVK